MAIQEKLILTIPNTLSEKMVHSSMAGSRLHIPSKAVFLNSDLNLHRYEKLITTNLAKATTLIIQTDKQN